VDEAKGDLSRVSDHTARDTEENTRLVIKADISGRSATIQSTHELSTVGPTVGFLQYR